jgi:hypothetical protein
VEDGLAVRSRGEPATAPRQVVAKLDVVVDLTVRDQDQVPLGVEERLMPSTQIDDRQTRVGEADVSIRVRSGIIGPSMTKEVCQAIQLFARRRVRTSVEESCDATHAVIPARRLR